MIAHSFQSSKVDTSDPTLIGSGKWNGNAHRVISANVNAGRAITAADGILYVTTGATNQTFPLPPVSSNPNVLLCVKKVDAGAGQVILAPNGSDTFDTGPSYTLVEQNQKVWFSNNGVSNWESLGTN